MSLESQLEEYLMAKAAKANLWGRSMTDYTEADLEQNDRLDKIESKLTALTNLQQTMATAMADLANRASNTDATFASLQDSFKKNDLLARVIKLEQHWWNYLAKRKAKK